MTEPLLPRAAAEETATSGWRVFLPGLLGAVIVGTAIAAQTYLSMLGHGHSYRSILAWQLSSWSVWALMAPLVIREAGGLASNRSSRRGVWTRLSILGALLIAVHVAVAAQTALWFQPYVPVVAAGYGDAVQRQLSMLPVDVLVYASLVLVGWALAVSRGARRLEIRESRLETELARAQLDALRLEIQPHFLFNTLNSIAALIRARSNDRALDMLVGLSELMRDTLERSGEQLRPLEDEIDFTRRYVELQQARFADRLDVRYRCDPAAAARTVPTFVLQPLVENAIRHGMGRQSRRCQVVISAEVDGEMLVLSVEDDGVGLAAGFDLTRDARTGLGNTRSRLERLYGPAATLRVGPAASGGAIARVAVPLDRGSRIEQIA